MNTERLNEDLANRGWATVEDVVGKELLLDLANRLGTPVAPYDRPLVQRLIPKDMVDAPVKTYSSRYGQSAFPLHTDLANWTMPPRYILLRSAVSTSTVPTLLLDGLLLPETFLHQLRAASFHARAWGRPFACNVLSKSRGIMLLRWDQDAMIPLDAFARHAAAALSEHLEDLQSAAAVKVAWSRIHQVLVIDNWRMLHARPDVSGDPARCLERVVVSTGES